MSKTVLITGSSSGIGRAAANYFHERGWNVAATMRKPEDETRLNQLDRVLVTRLDVQDSQSITTAMDAVAERFGGIDVVVNNAGYGAYGLLEATPMEKIRRQFDVNVIGLYEVTKAALPLFRAQRDGVIVNISSIGGRMTFPMGSLYHGSKFAVEGLSEALGFELAAIGCKIKIVEPGIVRTDFGGRSLDVNTDSKLTEYEDFVSTIFGAMGSMADQGSEPEVVAEVIYRAATDGTDQLRYTAGDDAAAILADRASSGDTQFMQRIRDQFGV